jgi:hypothetical protein
VGKLGLLPHVLLDVVAAGALPHTKMQQMSKTQQQQQQQQLSSLMMVTCWQTRQRVRQAHNGLTGSSSSGSSSSGSSSSGGSSSSSQRELWQALAGPGCNGPWAFPCTLQSMAQSS